MNFRTSDPFMTFVRGWVNRWDCYFEMMKLAQGQPEMDAPCVNWMGSLWRPIFWQTGLRKKLLKQYMIETKQNGTCVVTDHFREKPLYGFSTMEVSQNGGTPIAGWFIRENPI